MNNDEPTMATMVDSDIDIQRDPGRVDCYIISPKDGSARSISVSATLLTVLAEEVERRGEQAVLSWMHLFQAVGEA